MNPVGSLPTPAVAVIKAPPLDQIPQDVKKMILNCLNFQEITNASVLNKLWQKLATDKNVWLKVAKQLNIPANLENAQQEVLDHCLYRSINEDFYKIAGEEIRKAIDQGKNQSAIETYKVLKHHLKKSFETVLKYIRSFSNYVPTTNQVRCAKKIIGDIALSYGNAYSHKILGYLVLGSYPNMELFTFTVNRLKEKETPLNYLTILQEAMSVLVRQGPGTAPFLKVLLDEGARPDDFQIADAANRSDLGNEHLTLLLDYSNASVRRETLSRLKECLKDDLKDLGKYGEKDNTDETDERISDTQSKFKNSCALIKAAPPATFGGTVKEIPNTCCVIL